MSKIISKIKGVLGEETLHEKEKELLEKISKLQQKLEKETNSEKWKSLAKDLNNLKEQLQDLHENDPLKLKYRLQKLTKELAEEEVKNQEVKTLKKYFQYIVEKDLAYLQKTSAEELKQLCNYDSIDFDMIIEIIKPKNYSYEKNYLQAIGNLYSLLENEFKIITENTPDYLLSAEDTLKLKCGNKVDISILVCAIMHKLGDYNAKVTLAVLSDFSIIHFVETTYKNKTLIFDFYNSQKYNDYLDSFEKVREKYKPEGKTIREIKYSFSKYIYEE